MTAVRLWLQLLAITALVVLGGCGGDSSSSDTSEGGMGGSGSGDQEYAEGGMGGSGSGTASGYGSIIVNDTRHFPIDPFADVFVDGERVAPDAVNEVDRGVPLGMTLEYVIAGDDNADLTEGTAIRIRANHRAIGPVTQVEPHLEVLGQPVLVTSETLLSDIPQSDVDNLTEGEVVKVDGHVNDTGTIRATRLAQPAASPLTWQLMGRVTNLDAANGSFTIGDQVVAISGVQPDCDPDLAEGRRVLVRAGRDTDTFGTDGKLDTTLSIRCLAEGLTLFGDDAPGSLSTAVEGIVTDLLVAEPDVISLNGQRVDIANVDDVLFGTLDDLRLGARIEVFGSLNTDTGLVTAQRIRFRDPLVTVTAPVDGGIAEELLLTLGIEVRSTPDTEDTSNLFANPSTAGQVLIEGFTTTDHKVYARKVFDEGAADAADVSLRGPVTHVDDAADEVALVDTVFDTGTAGAISLSGTVDRVLCGLLACSSSPPELEDQVSEGAMGVLSSSSWDGLDLDSGDLELINP